jgi:hypothetical protein
MHAVATYRAGRRAAGCALNATAGYRHHVARVATARGETPVMATTALAWATLAPSEAQRHHRLPTVVRCARFRAAEDPRHEMPPEGRFSGRRQRPTPYLVRDAELEPLLGSAGRLGPPGS